MTTLRSILKLLEPIRTRVANMVARGVVRLVDDSFRLQEVQLEALPGETIGGAERFQEYGFTSVPLPPTGQQSAEAVVVFAGGGRDHPLVIAVDDRRYRLKGLAGGEVALYDDRGAKVLLGRSGLEVYDPTEIKLEATDVVPSTVTLSGGQILLEVGSSSIEVGGDEIILTATSIELNQP